MINKAKLSDLQEIKKLTEACAAALRQQGIHQWNENYPSRHQLRADIENEDLYIYQQNNQIIGIVMLSTRVDEVYKPVNWITKTTRQLYVHRLAVLPEHWGKGFAQRLMDFAEDFARKNECISVRLDTFSQNQRNQRFYEARGYRKLEDIYFPQKSKHPFHCYELVL